MAKYFVYFCYVNENSSPGSHSWINRRMLMCNLQPVVTGLGNKLLLELEMYVVNTNKWSDTHSEMYHCC